jgi:hypothetical protein
MQQFFRFIACRLDTAQHVSGIPMPIIKSSTTAVAASGFTVGAVSKRQAINLRNCCIWLVDSFECMMMHRLENPKRITLNSMQDNFYLYEISIRS